MTKACQPIVLKYVKKTKLGPDPPYIDRVRLEHDLVENISSNNTLHIFTPFIFMLTTSTLTIIKIDITEKTVTLHLPIYWGN